MREEEFDRLLADYRRGTISGPDRERVNAWLAQLSRSKTSSEWSDEELTELRARLIVEAKAVSRKPVVRRINRNPYRWVAAACLVILGYYFLVVQPRGDSPVVLDAAQVYPSEVQATITLADGKVIHLKEEGQSLFLRDGEVFYEDNQSVFELDRSALENQYVQLRTEKGKNLSIILDDGTRIKLNANSTLNYPLKFDDTIRNVALNGEAYFEVEQQADRHAKPVPFVVTTNETRIEVLGTRFNVKAYEQDPLVKTSLLSGRVRVHTSDGTSHQLLPDQQAVFDKLKKNTSVVPVLAEETVLWTDNLFSFKNADLKEIMDEIERWYDVRVDIHDWPGDRFYGQVNREEPLSEVIRIIEASSKLRFELIQVKNERRLILKI